MKWNAVATTLFGLEKIVSFEIARVGGESIRAENGRVFFEGDASTIASVNIESRTAERVLLVLSSFQATDFDSLFQAVRSVRWSDYIGRTDAFPVKGYSRDSVLSSVPALQSVIKKAIVEQMKQAFSSPFLTEKSGVTYRIRFSLVADRCTLMLDTSGEGLHKRGYRPLQHEAPIRETLAAGIVDLARIGRESAVADPFCGSGTILIEAALRGRRMAPGLGRSFAAERYPFFDRHAFPRAKEQAEAAIDRSAPFFGRGFDLDGASIRSAQENARRAGVEDALSFEQGDAREFTPQATEKILTNPPYGERMLSREEASALTGSFLRRQLSLPQQGIYLISSDRAIEREAGRKADRRRKLYNGMIPATLYSFLPKAEKP